jgi:transposase
MRTNLGAIFVSLELSRSTWLITSVSPGGGEKMSKHGVSAGNIAALLARLSELKQKAFERTEKSFQVIVIQEAGLDGFWLQSEGVESHVVDAASIATSRLARPANGSLPYDSKAIRDFRHPGPHGDWRLWRQSEGIAGAGSRPSRSDQ